MNFLSFFRRLIDRHGRTWRQPNWPTRDPRGPVHFDGPTTMAAQMAALRPGRQPNVVDFTARRKAR